MKTFLLLLLLSIPGLGNTAVPTLEKSGKITSALSCQVSTQPGHKNGFIKRLAERILQKRIYKAANALGRKYGQEGKWLAIIGLACGVVGAIAIGLLGILEYFGLIAALVLGLGGLILSLIGLDVATSHERRIRWIRNIAIAGIILDLLLIASGAGLLVLALAFGA